jgi:hypothetical protein
MRRPHLVITSIQTPNRIMRAFADQCSQHGFEFIVVGDTKSPKDFHIDGCRFLAVNDPMLDDFEFAEACPTAHYSRKNIGYLVAMAGGADLIVETDDDNEPTPEFWHPRRRRRTVPLLQQQGWVNVYRYFSDSVIWPRGLPLDAIHRVPPALHELSTLDADCPIQQGLANGDPDVDAVYRLTMALPQAFRTGIEVALGSDSWSPFNSQNTAWWPDAYPLLYLPSYCSFRMTDIWRSFVAQRIAWANGWQILYHSPTVTQDRNEHDLMRDFEQEVPGYVGNARMAKLLAALEIEPGVDRLSDNLRLCYAALVKHGFIGAEEQPLLDRWLSDCQRLRTRGLTEQQRCRSRDSSAPRD